ncbi:MAG TPA: capsule assembly Wzi family protein [Kangiella sp.]
MKVYPLLLLLFSTSVMAEPWLDTRDVWLRADIEQLASEGVIKAPITTWPLPWASIIQDLEDASQDDMEPDMIPAFLRVKRKAGIEMGSRTQTSISLRAGNQNKLLRHFGDERREDAELTARASGLGKTFAWNIEATKALDPIDGEEERLDHSYIAAIAGNWIISAGAQERWYGPGWDTSLILSNNARPVPSISIQRNYSDPFETPWLSWIGPWSLNAFAGQLESDRFIPHAKLLGMSVTFKPFDSLEIGLRRTAQWGGEGRPESLSSLVDLTIGRTNCDQIEDGCDDRLAGNEAGNQLAGIDFNWRIPTESPLGSFYGQMVGEDEAGYAPSRKFYQLGYKNSFYSGDFAVLSYIEYSDTENEYSPNLTYNHGIYQSGYRAEGRSIGSTYDNDTQSLSWGILASHKNGHRYKIRLATVDMNSDNVDGNHSVTSKAVNFRHLEFQYQYPIGNSIVGFEIDIKDRLVDSFGYQQERFNVGISWEMTF